MHSIYYYRSPDRWRRQSSPGDLIHRNGEIDQLLLRRLGNRVRVLPHRGNAQALVKTHGPKKTLASGVTLA